MGGHGGLNILPQKKWNVYNYDNRQIVEKDKKEAAQKKKAEKEKKRQDQFLNKIQILKEENGDNQKGKKQKHSFLSEELRKMNQSSQHINLFEKEQQIIENRQIVEIKRIQESEFLKDKDMDFSSKFLGTYGNDEKRPWYAKKKGEHHKKQKRHYHEEKQRDRSIKKEYNERKRSRSRQRSREKAYIKEEKQKTDIEMLREKRLKREQKEKLKSLLLKSRR